MSQGSICVAAFTVTDGVISMDNYPCGSVVNVGVDKSVYVVVDNHTIKVSGYTSAAYMQQLLDVEMDSDEAVPRPIIELAGLLCCMNSNASTVMKDRVLHCFNTSSVSQPDPITRAVNTGSARFQHLNTPAL